MLNKHESMSLVNSNFFSFQIRSIAMAIFIALVLFSSVFSTGLLLSSVYGDDDDLSIPDNENNLPNDNIASDIIKGQGLVLGDNHDNYIIASEFDDTVFG